METLRFAPLIRVSTEKQKNKGESLRTQTTQIKEYVASLHGVIPETCWRYSGQEHATPDQERAKLEQLLSDSSKGVFDAVIVCDPSRWSRDNRKSKDGLDILRNNKIRFFVGTIEYNLYDPIQNFQLGVATEINEMQAKVQKLKSITNRIHRARNGEPTAGKLPYGRLWNKELKQWSIDPVKQEIIKDTAKRYLAGESIKKIALSYNVDSSTLFKSLTQRCGDTWECRYVDRELNVDETVTMTIPRLLDQTVIDAVKASMEKNITYVRGNRKHEYLLQGMIYCRRCGFKLSSFRNNYGTRYYRPSEYNKSCTYKKFIPADAIETAVLIKLVQTFGDHEKVQQAILRATPDTGLRDELIKDRDNNVRLLRRIDVQKNNIIESIGDGVITKEDAKATLTKIKKLYEDTQILISNIDKELNNMPDPKHVKRVSLWAAKVISDATRNNPAIIFKRSFAWKRKLVERAFGGVNHNNHPYGVFIDHVDGKFTYEIKGLLINTVNTLPMTEDEIDDAFHNEPGSNSSIAIKGGLPRLNLIEYNINGTFE
jgi:site-specific DNA recombinase